MPSRQDLFETALRHLDTIDCLAEGLRDKYNDDPDSDLAYGLIIAVIPDIKDCINDIYNNVREVNTETYCDTIDNIHQWIESITPIDKNDIASRKQYVLSEYIHVINIYSKYEDWCLENDMRICKLSMFAQCLCDYLDLNEEEKSIFTRGLR